MSEPTGCTRVRPRPDESELSSLAAYCHRCDTLVGLDGFHVLEVAEREGKRGPWLRVVVESAAQVMGCPTCGVVVGSHGRSNVRLIDSPCFGRPVQLVWRKRTWNRARTAENDQQPQRPVRALRPQHPPPRKAMARRPAAPRAPRGNRSRNGRFTMRERKSRRDSRNL